MILVRDSLRVFLTSFHFIHFSNEFQLFHTLFTKNSSNITKLSIKHKKNLHFIWKEQQIHSTVKNRIKFNLKTERKILSQKLRKYTQIHLSSRRKKIYTKRVGVINYQQVI